MVAERRALEAEAAPVERAHLPVDDHLGRKRAAACDAHQQLRRTHDWLARLFERHEGTAVEAMLAPAEIASPAIDDDLERKIGLTAHADLHDTDGT